MTSTTHRALSSLALAAALTVAIVGGAEAGTLETLERERASLVDTFLDPALSPGKRQTRIRAATGRLVDLERMVIRDDELVGRNTMTTRSAFENYDLTFLVHASAERGLTPFDLWLEQIGLSGEALGAARVGRR